MEKFNHKINSWIQERLIPRLVENQENEVKFSISRPNGSFFVSNLFFVTIHLAKNDDRHAVVKLPSQNPDVSYDMEFDGLFANEILFYNQIACDHDKDYPKCYIVGKDPTFNSVIVLENVRTKGYTVCPQKVNVDFDYIVAGLKSIGRLHGHTYAIKESEPARFRQILHSIHEIRYRSDDTDKRVSNMANIGALRVLRAYRDKFGDSEFTAALKNVLEDSFANVVLKCIEPAEPLATIVHGDCTINNMLYRECDGTLEAMLIDFGMVRHSSPATDIGLFLYVTAAREHIRDRFEELFSAYHEALTECLKEHGIWDSSKYSREAFLQEYRRRGVFGYFGVAVFFRHIMTIYEHDNAIPEISDAMNDGFFASDEGCQSLDVLCGMLDDLRVDGMLDHFVEKSK